MGIQIQNWIIKYYKQQIKYNFFVENLFRFKSVFIEGYVTHRADIIGS